FERTYNSTVQWHRVLLAGGGQAGGFYYALDITNVSDNPVAPPRFLWQLSTDAAGNPIFGNTVPTPAIAIVPTLASDGTRTQVAVAILPGGSGTLASTCPTPPKPTPTSGITTSSTANPNNPQGSPNYFNVTNSPPPLRCWSNTFTHGNPGTNGNQFGNGMA